MPSQPWRLSIKVLFYVCSQHKYMIGSSAQSTMMTLSVNVFYVCSHQGDIRLPKIIYILVSYANLPTGLWTISLTITSIRAREYCGSSITWSNTIWRRCGVGEGYGRTSELLLNRNLSSENVHLRHLSYFVLVRILPLQEVLSIFQYVPSSPPPPPIHHFPHLHLISLRR